MSRSKSYLFAFLLGLYRDKHYFLSRYSDTEWYFWCEELKEKQMFASGEELYRKATIDGKLLCEELTNIRIDCIL